MPALNFKAAFEPKILDGTKTLTIRRYRKDGKPHCHPGDILSIYIGMRTKACRLITKVAVTEKHHIRITAEKFIIGRRKLADVELYALAKADGFSDWDSMRAFFEKTHGLPFDGVMYRWKPL